MSQFKHSTACCAIAVVLLLGGRRAAAQPSAFCHTIDGTFSDCTPGAPIEEWADVTGESFLNGGTYVYGDQNPSHTTLFLMYDYLLGTFPLGVSDCGTAEFDVFENSKLDHYVVSIGNCATNGFDVDVNGVKLPERLEEDIHAAYGFGVSPNSATPHQMFELSVPLVLVYQVDDPRFWTSGFPVPPADANPDADFDGDGVLDATDNCRFTGNPLQEDIDQNGQGDACQPCAGGDADGDGVPNAVDDCPTSPDRPQRDFDGDGHGDRCDNCPNFVLEADCGGKVADQDKDGVGDGVDNCVVTPNVDQSDADHDGIGNVCDGCVNDATNTCDGPVECKACSTDSDGDGVLDDVDNCRSSANSDQADGDGDEVGDVCDNCPVSPLDDCLPKADGDGDGISNEDDNCPRVANADQADADGDGFGNACDPCPDSADNDCIACVATGAAARGVGDEHLRGHMSILTAHADGSTSNEPRAGCESPTLCQNDDGKAVSKFVKKKLSALVKCAKLGMNPCTAAAELALDSGLSAGCQGVAECAVDSAAESALGDNNPAGIPVVDDCAKSVADNSRKFVSKMVSNHLKDQDDKTFAQEWSRRDSITGKCPSPLPAAASLGNGCDGKATLAESLDCLFDQLNRANPLP